MSYFQYTGLISLYKQWRSRKWKYRNWVFNIGTKMPSKTFQLENNFWNSFGNISRLCSRSASQNTRLQARNLSCPQHYDLILQVSGKPEYSLAERTVSSFIHTGNLQLRWPRQKKHNSVCGCLILIKAFKVKGHKICEPIILLINCVLSCRNRSSLPSWFHLALLGWLCLLFREAIISLIVTNTLSHFKQTLDSKTGQICLGEHDASPPRYVRVQTGCSA